MGLCGLLYIIRPFYCLTWKLTPQLCGGLAGKSCALGSSSRIHAETAFCARRALFRLAPSNGKESLPQNALACSHGGASVRASFSARVLLHKKMINTLTSSLLDSFALRLISTSRPDLCASSAEYLAVSVDSGTE